MNKTFSCNAAEWEFARYHSKVSNADRGVKGESLLGCLAVMVVPLAMLLVYAVLKALLSTKSESALGIVWLKDLSVTCGVLAAIYFVIRTLRRRTKYYRQPESGATIPYIIIDEEGISINLNNNLDKDVVSFFKWSSIKRISVDVTKDLNRYSSRHYNANIKEKDFAALSGKLPEFREPVSDVYTDRFTLMLNYRYGNYARQAAIVQIPKGWLEDGQLAALLREIQHRCAVPVESFNEDAQPYFTAWAGRYLQ